MPPIQFEFNHYDCQNFKELAIIQIKTELGGRDWYPQALQLTPTVDKKEYYFELITANSFPLFLHYF